MPKAQYTCIECNTQFWRQSKTVGDPEAVCCSKSCGLKRTHRLTHERAQERYPTKDAIEQAFRDVGHFAGAAKALGLSRGSLHSAVKFRGADQGLLSRGYSYRPYTDDEIFTLKSSLKDPRRYSVRTRFKKLTQDRFVCWLCTLPPVWRNVELTLQMDHINGNPYDDRFENLRWLCPNCHSQTDTYVGKKRR